ncbi:MAG TPA: hypothetical protein VL860_11870, partial [Planctomycetota bacterium]|nr:hypothetical protein [Planctomycetota bacterium]
KMESEAAPPVVRLSGDVDYSALILLDDLVKDDVHYLEFKQRMNAKLTSKTTWTREELANITLSVPVGREKDSPEKPVLLMRYVKLVPRK